MASKSLTRRRFIHRASALAASLVAPYFVPATALAAPARPGPNDRVGIGFIGTGSRARQLIDHLPAGGRIVAISDVYLHRAEETNAQKHAAWPIYQDYRALLDRQDVDAVVVATPDHGRVLPCIHACQAGKDIYAEKPLTLTIREGRVLVEAVRRHQRILQVGTQQRSMEMNRFACQFVRDGGLGKLRVVMCRNYPGPGEFAPPEQPVPPGLDWDAWCGSTELVPYNEQLRVGWMGHRRYSGGEMTNWGAHGLDQVQWALGTDQTGPVEVRCDSTGPYGKVSFRYAEGLVVKLHLEDTGPWGGAVFVGEHGKIEINRNKFTTNPPDLIPDPPNPAVAEAWEGPGWIARPHLQNWLDAIASRRPPVADVEIGHRSVTLCHLANIARQLGRNLKWDPVRETFPEDEQAASLCDRPRRAGYELPEIS